MPRMFMGSVRSSINYSPVFQTADRRARDPTFDPFLNYNAHNTAAARSRVYVTLHNSGEYELPIGYATVNGDLFNLPAGPVSFAIGGEGGFPRWILARVTRNTNHQNIGSAGEGGRRGEPDVL